MATPPPSPGMKTPRELLDECFKQIFDAILLCVEKSLHTAALVLLYSGIDAAAWLAADDSSPNVRTRFTTWADKFMLPKLPPPGCSAMELYGARCGLVHTLTAESDLTAKGARKIIYAWKPSTHEGLSKLSSLADPEQRYIAVQGEDLIAAFASGLDDCLLELAEDRQRLDLAMRRAGGFLRTLSPQDVDAMLRRIRDLLGPDW